MTSDVYLFTSSPITRGMTNGKLDVMDNLHWNDDYQLTE